MDINPEHLNTADRYKLMIGGIVPRPIAWVSTQSPDGRPNLAPFSFFAGVSSQPMALCFCPASTPEGGPKDTLRNAAPPSEGGTGEFVVNIVPHALGRQMAACGESLPFGESEWDLAKLTPEPSAVVAPARVQGSPLSFECRTLQVVRLTPPGTPSGGNIVIGRVVHIRAIDGLIDERLRIDPARLDAIARLGGQSYCTTRERFELPYGRAAVRSSAS